MMLSDDKVSHTSHMLLKGLLDNKLVVLKVDDSEVRREIKKTIGAQLKIGEEIDAAVTKKLLSFSRKLAEGSPEWEVLYKKFYEEEEAKRGSRYCLLCLKCPTKTQSDSAMQHNSCEQARGGKENAREADVTTATPRSIPRN